MSEGKLYYNIANNFIKAGMMPFIITDTIVEIMKTVFTEEQAKFLLNFKSSYQLEQIKDLTDLDDEALDKMLKELMHIGAVIGLESRSAGMMVYRLAPFFPGMLEFTLMRGEFGEKQKKLAQLWEEVFNEMVDLTQKNYTTMVKAFSEATPIDRVIPVGELVDVPEEVILPFEEISRIIEKTEAIGLATCYCRHRKDLLNDPCKITDNRKNCFVLGRAAKFLISQDFAAEISKDEALKILKTCEDQGLVHKAFHTKFDLTREEDGICSCCKCCCGTFEIHYRGATPLLTMTSYIAKIIEDDCIGCGTCVEKCNASAIELEDDIAVIDENVCIGCGVCVHLCPENAIKFERTGPRKVMVPPVKLMNK